MTAAVAFLLNHCFHMNGDPELTCDEYGPDEDVTGEYALRRMQEEGDRQMELLSKAGDVNQKALINLLIIVCTLDRIFC